MTPSRPRRHMTGREHTLYFYVCVGIGGVSEREERGSYIYCRDSLNRRRFAEATTFGSLSQEEASCSDR